MGLTLSGKSDCHHKIFMVCKKVTHPVFFSLVYLLIGLFNGYYFMCLFVYFKIC